MSIWLGLGLTFGAIAIVALIMTVIAYFMKKKLEATAEPDLPEGTDQSDFARQLQDKYKEERDSGEYTRPGFK
jgi:hypothetical protein